jgi:hypothetical protein
MTTLVTRLGLSQQDQRSLAKTVGRVKSINEFFADTLDGLKSVDFVEAAQKASPWLAAIGSTVADVVPAVKFVVKLFEKLTAMNDPTTLGVLAFTVAYEQSVVQAVRAVGAPAGAVGDVKVLTQNLRSVADAIPEAALDFTRVSFPDALAHPFVQHADGILDESARAVGYTELQRRELTNEVHQRFTVHLKTLVSHRDTTAKFEPFTRFLEVGGGDNAAIAALMDHAQYQRALFQERPVFGKEVFALSHVYVDTECGKLVWAQITEGGERGERVDPFSEEWGGRQRLGQTVLDLIGDPGFRDAIVIQGVAGAGKSAFTQWLASELVRQGLRPIRVLLRDVRLERNRPIVEALGDAIRYRDESERGSLAYPRPDDPFLDGAIFKERVQFGRGFICPYVLILDGWDEISISVSEGFKVRLDRMLEQIRTTFLTVRDVPVRVILTGRPSPDLDNSFLLKKTPILTIRPFNPDDLEEFLAKLEKSVNERPLPLEGTAWPRVEDKRFKPALKRYRDSFDARKEATRSLVPEEQEGALEILGLPLLAFLAARLLSHATLADAEKVIESPTTLYRNLVDLTCAGGKFVGADEETEQGFALKGRALRDLLRRTATAMTVYGKENIPYDELEMRLDLGEKSLGRAVDDTTRDNALSQLIVSYYFKGGHTELGCEFLHKSFREYLYAEAIVELLKVWGRAHGHSRLAEREPYWKDFDEADPRYDLSRNIASSVSAQWLRPEIVRHLSDLLAWEIHRSVHGDQPPIPEAQPTTALAIGEWETVRDALADLWDWWGEGVHLRPQPTFGDRRTLEFKPPLAHQLVMETIPLALAPRQIPQPPRMTTIDSHLGDALFRLAQVVHFRIAEATGWLGTPQLPVSADQLWSAPMQVHRYQVRVSRGDQSWTLFAPGGELSRYWDEYVARINAAGWRPQSIFPSVTDLRAISLEYGSVLQGVDTDFSFCNLAYISTTGGNLAYAKFDRARILARWVAQFLYGTSFVETYFERAYIGHSTISDSLFSGAHGRVEFEACTYSNADFRGAEFWKVHFDAEAFTDAKFDEEALDRYKQLSVENE